MSGLVLFLAKTGGIALWKVGLTVASALLTAGGVGYTIGKGGD